MPYITPKQRKDIIDYGKPPTTSGELSFVLSHCIREYLKSRPNGGWSTISEIYGALNGARLAFENEVVIPFEDHKRTENGPVFDQGRG